MVTKGSVEARCCSEQFVTCLSFHGVGVMASRPNPRPRDHPLLAVRESLFNIFAATLRICRPSPPSATRSTNTMRGLREQFLPIPLHIASYCQYREVPCVNLGSLNRLSPTIAEVGDCTLKYTC